jgi:hypothetical protein
MVRLSKSLRRLLVAVGILAIVGVVAFIGYQQLSETADYAPLIGKWVRPDGGYILDIKSISIDGKIEMAYLNPQPINVSKAQVDMKTGKIELLIELRDRNYPGNYYTLTFDSESNRLVGVYHHLGLNQNFDVYFIRR